MPRSERGPCTSGKTPHFRAVVEVLRSKGIANAEAELGGRAQAAKGELGYCEHHAEKVAEIAVRRRLIPQLGKLTEMACGRVPIDDLIEKAEVMLYEVS